MKRQELIKPELSPSYTKLCKKDIKPSIKFFGDDPSKHLKDMADVKMAFIQMQKSAYCLHFKSGPSGPKAEVQEATLHKALI